MLPVNNCADNAVFFNFAAPKGLATQFMPFDFDRDDSMPILPINLKKADDHTLQIDWEDGVTTLYPMDFLRRNCPCASCDEARFAKPASNPLRVLQPHEIISAQVTITEAEVMGRYALHFSWSDGHREGIYTFDFLRELAQNPVCQIRQTKTE